MRMKILKRALRLCSMLVVFIVASMVALITLTMLLFNPEDFQLDVEHWLSQETGRKVVIKSGIKYTYFPWLGFVARDVEVSQPPDFVFPKDGKPFLSVRELKVRLRILPLILRKEIMLGKIKCLDPTFHLHRKKDGTANWQGLFPDSLNTNDVPKMKTKSGETHFAMNFKNWSGLHLEQGSILLHDELMDEELYITNITFSTSPGLEFTYKLSCDVQSTRTQIQASTALNGACHVTLAPYSFSLRNAELTASANYRYKDKQRTINLTSTGDYFSKNQHLRLNKISLDTKGIKLGGVLTGKNLLKKDFTLHGSLFLKKLVPEILLPEPDAHTAALLKSLSLNTLFKVNREQVSFEKVYVKIADTTIRGEISKKTKPASQLLVRLNTEKLRLDALLPQQTSPSQAPDPNSPLLPQWLYALDSQTAYPGTVDVQWKIDQLHWKKTQAKKLHLQLKTTPEGYVVRTTADNFLRGKAACTITSRHKEKAQFDVSLKNASAKRLFNLIDGMDAQKGTINITATGSMNDATLAKMAASLSGEAHLVINNGEIRSTSKPKASASKKKTSATPFTRFSKLDTKISFKGPGQKSASKLYPVFPYTTKLGIVLSGHTSPLDAKTTASTTFNGVSTVRCNVKDMSFLDLERASFDGTFTTKNTLATPPEPVRIVFNAKGKLDFVQDRLLLEDFTLFGKELRCYGNVTAKNILGLKQGKQNKRSISGRVNFPTFNVYSILKKIGVEPLIHHAPYPFTQVALQTRFLTEDDWIRLENLKITMDRTNITGRASVKELGHPNRLPFLWLSLKGDHFNLDDYIESEDVVYPRDYHWKMDFLKYLRGSAEVTLRSATFLNHKNTNVRAKASAGDSKLKIGPLTADLYEGVLAGYFQFALLPGKDRMEVSTDFSVTNFQLEPMIRTWGGGDAFGGLTTASLKAAGFGYNWNDVWETLKGNGQIEVHDGFCGLLDSQEQQDSTKTKNTPKRHEKRTFFSFAKATLVGDKGIARTNDLTVHSNIVKATGKGQCNIPKGTMDLSVTVTRTGAPTIPVRIFGRTLDPSVEVNSQEMVVDTVGRLGGSFFDMFTTILTLPFRAVGAIGNGAPPKNKSAKDKKKKRKNIMNTD